MEIKNKKNVFVYILSILLVILIVVSVFLIILLNNKNKEYNNLKKKYDDIVNKKDTVIEFKEYNSGNFNYDYLKVVAYGEKVYAIESSESMNKGIEIIKNGININDNKYKESDITITKIDLKSDDILDVFITHDPIANDAVPMAFIILKDGKVKKYSADWNNLNNGMTLKDASEFEGYSIKKINSYDCSKTYDNGLFFECTMVKSDILLNDNTSKSIEIKVNLY